MCNGMYYLLIVLLVPILIAIPLNDVFAQSEPEAEPEPETEPEPSDFCPNGEVRTLNGKPVCVEIRPVKPSDCGPNQVYQLGVCQDITPYGTITDVTPPKILQPKDITINAIDSRGSVVEYEVLAIDDVDQIVKPFCRPSSGSLFPIGDTTIVCLASDSAGNSATQVSFTITVNTPSLVIPDWIKEVAAFWCDNKIDDAPFIEGIQYLINNDIIIVQATSLGYNDSQEIPSWIKNNACWWSQGLITNSDFASGLQYLIGQGIIKV